MKFSFLIKNITSNFTKYGAHIARSSHRRCSVKKDVLQNFTNLTEKPLVGVFFPYICRVEGFFKNTYFEEHLRVAASASQVAYFQMRSTTIFRTFFNVFTLFIVV